jgi:hypothetical protein
MDQVFVKGRTTRKLGHAAKKLPGFFDSNMLQHFEFERSLSAHMVPREFSTGKRSKRKAYRTPALQPLLV